MGTYVKLVGIVGPWADRGAGRFIKVANETMCRPIRSLTEAKGHALAKHVCVVSSSFRRSRTDFSRIYRLASFGGAGGQHATEIARLLGISRILIHRHSSILSAYGLALADRYVLPSPSLPSLHLIPHSSSAHTSSKNPPPKSGPPPRSPS